MTHSNFKSRATEVRGPTAARGYCATLNKGVGKCSCGQTFEFLSERDIKMKLRGPCATHQMHCKFCSKPPVAFNKVEVPKKATMMREQQLNEYERIRSVHN